MIGHAYMYVLFNMFVIPLETEHMFGAKFVFLMYATTQQSPDWVQQTFHVYLVRKLTQIRGQPA